MKLQKSLLLILLITLILNTTVVISHAQEGKLIGEIVIEGPTRSDKDIIKRQLPYSVGDQWEDRMKDLTYQRLAQLHIFSPLTLNVQTEQMDDNKIRVLINVEDTSIYMIHPIEFTVFKITDLASQQLHQYFRNPFGNGTNFYTGIDWSSDPGWMIGLEQAGYNGKTYSWQHNDFDDSKEFNDITYDQEGFREEIVLSQIPVADWNFIYSLDYQENSYRLADNSEKDQRYAILGTEVKWSKYGKLSLKLDYGFALKELQSDFERLTMVWDMEAKESNRKLIYSLKGGIASSDTPFNYQFTGGGYSKDKGGIPLRGHDYELAGTGYLTATTEYHKSMLVDKLWGIIFFDGGKMIPDNSNFSEEDWMLDGGCGVAYDTFLGPIRFDVGFNLLGSGQTANLTFGHTF